MIWEGGSRSSIRRFVQRIVVTTSNALRNGSHSFTCKLHHARLYSRAAEHQRPLAGTHFTVPWRVEGWVDLGGWLRTEIKCLLRESNPDTVTNPSTNRAQCRLTSLIWTNDAAIRQRWESRPYPQPKQILNLATSEGCKAELSYVTLNPRPVNR